MADGAIFVSVSEKRGIGVDECLVTGPWDSMNTRHRSANAPLSNPISASSMTLRLIGRDNANLGPRSKTRVRVGGSVVPVRLCTLLAVPNASRLDCAGCGVTCAFVAGAVPCDEAWGADCWVVTGAVYCDGVWGADCWVVAGAVQLMGPEVLPAGW